MSERERPDSLTARLISIPPLHGKDRGTLPQYLPCPICGGVEGCDHTYAERERAASQPQPEKEGG